jgi:hypothetical protein
MARRECSPRSVDPVAWVLSVTRESFDADVTAPPGVLPASGAVRMQDLRPLRHPLDPLDIVVDYGEDHDATATARALQEFADATEGDDPGNC